MGVTKEFYLEDYARFFNNEKPALTLDQLNKITRVNGLIKLRKFNKSSLLDALRAMELTPPGRSTVGECLLRSSANADLSLSEVAKDVASLGWQECPIVSILTVGNVWAVEEMEETAPISSSYSSDQAEKNGGKGGWEGSGAKRKRKYVAALAKLPLIGPLERTTGSTSGSRV